MGHLKLLIIGLDSVPPATAFGSLANRMPFLSQLRQEGMSGPLRSTDPPITVPAWVTMTTGRSPGQLGIYGFRKRVPDSYDLALTTVGDLRFPRLWDLASGEGLTSAVVSVPLTFPVSADPRVFMTGCFLTPSPDSRWASTHSLKNELINRFGPYITDVEGFRGADPHQVIQACTRLTNQHFEIFRHLLETRSPHFGMIVDLGPDRLHHSLGRAVLATHPRHGEDSNLTRMAADYYALLDSQIERTVRLADRDTVVLVVSDHGVRPLEGAFCINEWLVERGYLTVQALPTTPTSLSQCRVDWSRTMAWAEGGYHGRLYINRKDREPLGIVTEDQSVILLKALEEELRTITSPSGLPSTVHSRDALYPDALGAPPDLTIYFGNLSLRCAGTLGHRALFIPGNDTGPDDVNHDMDGILVMRSPEKPSPDARDQILMQDVFATSLKALGLSAPPGTGGRALY